MVKRNGLGLAGHAGKHHPVGGPPYNPHPSTVRANLSSFPTKKQREAIPPGLIVEGLTVEGLTVKGLTVEGWTSKEKEILDRVKRRAYRLDRRFLHRRRLSLGWGFVIGLLPVMGPVMKLGLELAIVGTCCAVDPPLDTATRAEMLLNVALDFVVGLVPFVGDLADAAYRCSTRNAILLEDRLRERGQRRLRDAARAARAGPC